MLSILISCLYVLEGFPGSSAGKESTCRVGDLGSIPGLEDPLEKGRATHSSISAWKILRTEGTWWATVHGVAESDRTERLHFTSLVHWFSYSYQPSASVSSFIQWGY